MLDLNLPVIDGSGVLAHLKRHPATREVPVYTVSGGEPEGEAAEGVARFLRKPISADDLLGALGAISEEIDERPRRVLLMAGDGALADALGAASLPTARAARVAGSLDEALVELQRERFDCLFVDLDLSAGAGLALVERTRSDPRLAATPIVAHTARAALPEIERSRLGNGRNLLVVTEAGTPAAVLERADAFLRRRGPREGRRRARGSVELELPEGLFQGRRVLIVDDDVRNVFAIASVVEAHGMEVLFADNGSDGIDVLRAHAELDVVLMDVMMPQMDGYETMRAIREMPEFASLPIIAVTAKAMKGDRERAIASGASDYITKPVDPDELLSLMGIWLYPADVR
jgi:CheY-like chemotaxis protein